LATPAVDLGIQFYREVQFRSSRGTATQRRTCSIQLIVVSFSLCPCFLDAPFSPLMQERRGQGG